MATQNSVAPDQVITTVWREYRLSLALLAAGIVMVVAILGFDFWANSTGNYSTSSFWTGLAIQSAYTAGGMLILLAGTVAYYHRSFLRQSRRNP
ncbi:MAG: hypothetical protein WB947_02925 [Thermoplasmata archaeon]